jgi:WD40 repeat protein
MRIRVVLLLTIALAFLSFGREAAAQLTAAETTDATVVYVEPVQSFIVPYAQRTIENSLTFHRKLFDYTPHERMSILLTDFSDAGNASAETVPHNLVTARLAPLSFAYETFTANERMNYLMNHEFVHVVTSDRASTRDQRFRRLFSGKVAPNAAHPESLLYYYLTAPRRAAPRWYQEGIAVFLDTWMAGGLGRAQGPYDEMVFRSMTLDESRFFDPLGLASELTKTDFRQESNSYLYGGRFMNYLAYQYSPESLIHWVSRTDGSKAYYASQFRKVYGRSLEQAWSDWIVFEKDFQKHNIAEIRKYPVTPYDDISARALGSLSRAYVDHDAQVLYAGVNYPGTLGYIGAISLKDGSIRKIRDIKGPRIYTVTSLTFDPKGKLLYYTADNASYRDLMRLDPATGRERLLFRDLRAGDLAFDKADSSIWGIRTFNGICTLIRIAAPYTEWKQVYSWPYGEVVYDLDLSPDGTRLVAAVGEINGKQTLRVFDVSSILSGDATALMTFELGTAVPSNFAFSPDGKYLYGSSYYTGVSNIFRFDLATRELEALTNSETGFFQPTVMPDGSLLVFRYTGEGFVPSRLASVHKLEDLSAISFLGHETVEKRPILKTWIAGSPADVPLETLSRGKAPYRPFTRLRLESIYPSVEGYKDTAAVGAHVRFSDPVGLNRLTFTAGVSPTEGLEDSERVHVRGEYQRYDWTLRAALNDSDFYDLFGPTKTSRKGYALSLGHLNYFVFDEPRRLTLDVSGKFSGNLDQLPEYQNVPVDVTTLTTLTGNLTYTNVRSSLGSVDDEAGMRWSAIAKLDRANGEFFTRMHGTYDLGVPLPVGHSSVWLRGSAGLSPQDRNQPFANFYFGGFGNNYVDYQDPKRYREYISFPGAEINEIGGRNYVKGTAEWNLPPIRFSRLGTPGLYASWIRPALFVSSLATNLDSADFRRAATSLGTQVDLRLTALSSVDLTLSFGAATVLEEGYDARRAWMASLTLLH